MSNINNATNITDVKSDVENSNSKSMVPARESGQPLLRLVNSLQDKFKSLPAVIKPKNKLPTKFDFGAMSSASQLLSHKFTMTYSSESYEKSVRELSIITLGIIGFIFVSIIGWKVSREVNFVNGGNFIYNTGLIGGILMLLTLVYSIIKRVGYLSRRLSSSHSYYFHIICGGTGALLIVIHSSFDFRSINSNVAMVSMLLILISGALGRYLYTQFSLMLHRLYLEIKGTEQDLYRKIFCYNCNAAKRVNEKLSEFTRHSFDQSGNAINFLIRSVSIFYHSLNTYSFAIREINKIINSASVLGDLEKTDVKNLRTSHRKEIGRYVYSITKMGYLSLFERLFRHWRILHVPFLYILFLTSIAHVVVVHMY